jgi:hypothetical protein
MAARLRLAAAGFLLAVLWFDLMFDVQAFRPLAADGTLPAPVLASMAAYYRRVLVDTWPMGAVVGAMMGVLVLATLVGLLLERPRWRGLAGLVLGGAPIALAFGRVVPNAIALGTGSGSVAADTALARGIAVDHVLCFAAMTAYLVLQLVPSAPPPRAAEPEAG